MTNTKIKLFLKAPMMDVYNNNVWNRKGVAHNEEPIQRIMT